MRYIHRPFIQNHKRGMMDELNNNALSDIMDRGKHKESNWRATSTDVIPSRLFINSLHNVTCGQSLSQTDIKLPVVSYNERETRVVCLDHKQRHHQTISCPLVCATGSLVNYRFACAYVYTLSPLTVCVIYTLKRDHNKALCRYSGQRHQQHRAACCWITGSPVDWSQWRI